MGIRTLLYSCLFKIESGRGVGRKHLRQKRRWQSPLLWNDPEASALPSLTPVCPDPSLTHCFTTLTLSSNGRDMLHRPIGQGHTGSSSEFGTELAAVYIKFPFMLKTFSFLKRKKYGILKLWKISLKCHS